MKLGVDHDSLYKMDFWEYSLHLKSLKDSDKSVKSNERIVGERFTKDSTFIDASTL